MRDSDRGDRVSARDRATLILMLDDEPPRNRRKTILKAIGIGCMAAGLLFIPSGASTIPAISTSVSVPASGRLQLTLAPLCRQALGFLAPHYVPAAKQEKACRQFLR